MGQVVVRYKVKPDRVEENERLVQRRVRGARTSATRAGSGTRPSGSPTASRFVHVASVDTADGTNPLGDIAAFAEFTRDIADRCDEPPLALDATVVGSYGLFG